MNVNPREFKSEASAPSAAPRRPAAPRGFTLIEILLVIMLLGILFAVTWPQLQGSARAEQLPESARRMKALFAMCRAQAMNEARRYRLLFERDGTITLAAQRDPIEAPDEYLPIERSWAREPVLLERVWIEGIQHLPDGPAPVLVNDDVIEFTQVDETPQPVEEQERATALNFEPNGLSGSMKWVLRSVEGRGLMVTLDGRLGRVQIDRVEALKPEEAKRPPSREEETASAADRKAAKG